MRPRTAVIQRLTKEVHIRGTLNLDGNGRSSISTGIRFLDHMMELFAKHGLFDLDLKAVGDLDIDLHHTNEDIGLALGEGFKNALGDKKGIRRMGSAFVPMDETLARVRAVVDISGRPYFRLEWSARKRQGAFRCARFGRSPRLLYDVDDARHLLESFVAESRITVHMDVLKTGDDIHHLLEAIFKAFGRAVRQAVEIDPRVKGIPSTKGKL